MYVYAFGSNYFSQLAHTSEIEETSTPIEIKFLRNKKITKIACGFFHTLILIQKQVFSFGRNEYLALGRDGAQYEILEVPLGEEIINISCGRSHSAVLTVKGTVYAWGTFRDSNDMIELESQVYMRKDPTIIAHNINCIKSNDNRILMIDKHGNIKYFGLNPYTYNLKWDQIIPNKGLRFILRHNVNLPYFDSIKSGAEHCFVLGDEKLYGWGKNSSGQLGNGRNDKTAEFHQIYI